MPHPVAPTEAHFAAAREQLRTLIDRTEIAWADVSRTDRDRFEREHPEADYLLSDENRQDSARRYLESSRETDDLPSALFDVRYGISQAADALATARLVTDDVDDETLLDESRALRREVDVFRESYDYEIANPAVGVGVLSYVERQLTAARLQTFGGRYVSGHSDRTVEFDLREKQEVLAGFESASRRIDDARRFYEDWRDGQDETRSVGDELDRRRRAAKRTVEEGFPSQDDEVDRIDAMPDTLAHEVQWHLYSLGPSDWYVRPPTGTLYDGLSAQAATDQAIALFGARAWEYAQAELVVEADTERIDPALAYRTKRRVADRFEMLRDRYGEEPTARILLTDVQRNVESANIGFPNRDVEGRHLRAEGYTWWLFALGQCVHFEDVLTAALPR